MVESAVRGLSGLSPPTRNSADFTDAAMDLLRWGYKLDGDPSELPARDRVAAELARLTGTDGGYRAAQKLSQRIAFDAFATALVTSAPSLEANIRELQSELRSDAERVQDVLTKAPWATGDPTHGAAVYEKYACNTCHHIGGRGFRVGPDLTGLGKRYDLPATITAIGLPSREVAPRFRAEMLILDDGRQVHGMPIYDSREAIIFRTRAGGFLRLTASQILARTRTGESLMPSGYLDHMSLSEVAHLVAFLRQDT